MQKISSFFYYVLQNCLIFIYVMGKNIVKLDEGLLRQIISEAVVRVV